MASASEDQLLCTVQSEEKTHVVTNQGSHLSRFSLPPPGTKTFWTWSSAGLGGTNVCV